MHVHNTHNTGNILMISIPDGVGIGLGDGIGNVSCVVILPECGRIHIRTI